MDLDAYFQRIGWRGARDTQDSTLAGLLAHHMRAIPFENFDVLLGRPPRLDLAALEDKLVTRRRGGYCFEHSTLFAAVLRELGFRVTTHSARVVMRNPRHASPRTHMFLTVAHGARPLMLDPGFGGLAPRVPMPVGVATGDYSFVSDAATGDHVLELWDGPKAQQLWTSTLQQDFPIDFEMANHFTATHPASPFTQNIMARAFIDDGEARIMNREATILRAGQPPQKIVLTDRAALRGFVAEHFGFDLVTLGSDEELARLDRRLVE